MCDKPTLTAADREQFVHDLVAFMDKCEDMNMRYVDVSDAAMCMYRVRTGKSYFGIGRDTKTNIATSDQ